MRRHAFAALALALLCACARATSAGGVDEDDQWRALDLVVERVEFGPSRTGDLLFRGGLALSGERSRFGGLSGLEVLDGERFLAVSDTANWYEGRLLLDESGALVGVADVRVTAMRGEDGAPYSDRDDRDSEGLTQLPDGRVAVSFERRQRVMIYDYNRDGPFGAAARGPSLAPTGGVVRNVGLEALASTEAGALVIGAEGGGGPTPISSLALDATAQPSLARYPLTDAFSLTGLDRLPNGDFVALERFFAPVIPPRARIAIFSADALTEGALLAPRRLAEIAPPMPVDNFEAISAVRMPDGATRIYILSDDNFSDRQRTLLLAFDIASDEVN